VRGLLRPGAGISPPEDLLCKSYMTATRLSGYEEDLLLMLLMLSSGQRQAG